MRPSPGGGGSARAARRGGVRAEHASTSNHRQLPPRNRAALRAKATIAKSIVWRHLRALESDGTHFRHQVPIGPYVADFACMAARFVIQIDGPHHGEEPNKAHDEARTRWLVAEGYRVIRFWNNDIVENPEGVLDVIHAALYGSRDAEPRR